MDDYNGRSSSGKLHISGPNPKRKRSSYSGEEYGSGVGDPRYRDSDPGYRGSDSRYGDKHYWSDPGHDRSDPGLGGYHGGGPGYGGSDSGYGGSGYGRSDFGYGGSGYGQPPQKKSKKLPVIIASVGSLVLLAVIAIVFFFILRNRVEGKYKAVITFDELLQAMGESNYSEDGQDTSDLKIDFYLDLDKDDEFHMYVKEEQLKEVMHSYIKQISPYNVSDEEIDVMVDEYFNYGDTSSLDQRGTYEVEDKTIHLTKDGDTLDGEIQSDHSIIISDDYSNDFKLVFKKQGLW